MAFSIRKKWKVQAMWKEVYDTSFITRLRKGEYTKELQKSTLKAVTDIANLSPQDELKRTVDNFFPSQSSNRDSQSLNSFLKKYPHLFHDLIRVISKHREYNNENGWYIAEGNFSEVATVFLFEGRPADIGAKIPGFVRTICKQSAFIEFTQKQKSLLDIGHYGFQKIPQKPRKGLIKKLIETSLIENIPNITPEEITKRFLGIKSKILRYLHAIYNVPVSDFDNVKNITECVEKLNGLMNHKSAKEQKRAWKILQAFYAWGGIEEIEKDEELLKSDKTTTAIKEKIAKSFGNNIQWGAMSEDHDGTTIFPGSFQWKGKKIGISWRIKSVKSILMKTWEDEDYGYLESIRDRLGIAITFPDDLEEQGILELMNIGSGLLANNGYILKNKGLLEESPFTQAQYESGKRPLLQSTTPGGDPNLQNASQSGFTGIHIQNSRKSLGCEIQYSRKSAMEWKKREDAIYKFRAFYDSLLRGEYIDSPRSILESTKNRISPEKIQSLVDPDTKKSLGLSGYVDIINYLIGKRIIIPVYAIGHNSKKILFFTTKTHKTNALAGWNLSEFPETDIDSPDSRLYKSLKSHLSNL